MKKIVLLGLLSSCFSFAANHVCKSRVNNFVIMGTSERMYLVYECDKTLTQCTPPQVFEALGFEEEGSFSLYGQRVTGQRTVLTMVKNQNAWTATLNSPYQKQLIDVLSCQPYKKK